MGKLYSDLAEVYEAMYKTFIDYKEESIFYSEILRKYNKKSVLEIGSGTGDLASYFKEGGYEYSGLDLSKEMIHIAKRKLPDCTFLEGDMRSFELGKPVESVIMTGRTISYLISNNDVNETFKNIHANMEMGGIFCFDFIDANRFIPEILKDGEVIHEANNNHIKYVREGKWELKLKEGMDLIWTAKYSKEVNGELVEIGKDTSTVRTFTKDELKIFLTINSFEIKEIINRASYAFPTYVIVAEKKASFE